MAKKNETVPGGLNLRGKVWVDAMGLPISPEQFNRWWAIPKYAAILERNGIAKPKPKPVTRTTRRKTKKVE